MKVFKYGKSPQHAKYNHTDQRYYGRYQFLSECMQNIIAGILQHIQRVGKARKDKPVHFLCSNRIIRRKKGRETLDRTELRGCHR